MAKTVITLPSFGLTDPGADKSIMWDDSASALTITGPAGDPYFMARLSGDQTITDNTETVVAFASEDYDSGSCFNTTNYRFTPNVAGYYYIGARLQLGGSSPQEGSCQLRIYGNKSNGANFYRVDGATTDAYYASFVRYANGSSTYFDVLAYQNVGSGSVTATAGTSSNFYGWRIA